MLLALAPSALFDTAKTDSCGSSFWLWHFGHCALSLPKISASNWWRHSVQRYSKIGMISPHEDASGHHDYLK
jgi:hypothetical protein